LLDLISSGHPNREGPLLAQCTATRWSLITNHGAVLIYISQHPTARISSIADDIGITERRVTRIVGDLKRAGFLKCNKIGRRNEYMIVRESNFLPPSFSGIPLHKVLAVMESHHIEEP
jgi:predicted transcriptional regulator